MHLVAEAVHATGSWLPSRMCCSMHTSPLPLYCRAGHLLFRHRTDTQCLSPCCLRQALPVGRILPILQSVSATPIWTDAQTICSFVSHELALTVLTYCIVANTVVIGAETTVCTSTGSLVEDHYPLQEILSISVVLGIWSPWHLLQKATTICTISCRATGSHRP